MQCNERSNVNLVLVNGSLGPTYATEAVVA